MKKYVLLFLVSSTILLDAMAQPNTSRPVVLKKNPSTSDQAAKADVRLIDLKRISDTTVPAPARVFPSAPLRKKKKRTPPK